MTQTRSILLLAFALTLTLTAAAQYTETVNIGVPGLYTDSPPIFDAAGNIYGATGGGTGECYPYGCGEIFQVNSTTQASNILYQFSGLTDGSGPTGRLTLDAKGNVYGVTFGGGNLTYCGGQGCGVVYELSPTTSGFWTETVLYAFTGLADGGNPGGGVIFDSKGNLYGVTEGGGISNCNGSQSCGVVFMLSPTSTGWKDTTLYTFTGGADGGEPSGLLTLDANDNVYGTAGEGGNTACRYGCGTIFRLTRVADGTWSFSRLYAFDGTKGQGPDEALVFDQAGNIYGATNLGGKSANNSQYCPFVTCGTVYELVRQSNGTWRHVLLHAFTGYPDGSSPYSGGVTLDAAGNVYGTAAYGGPQTCDFTYDTPGCGTAFKLSPVSGGGWIFNRIFGFDGDDGDTPNGSLVLDSSGNLWGTSVNGFDGYGNIFELSPPASKGNE